MQTLFKNLFNLMGYWNYLYLFFLLKMSQGLLEPISKSGFAYSLSFPQSARGGASGILLKTKKDSGQAGMTY